MDKGCFWIKKLFIALIAVLVLLGCTSDGTTTDDALLVTSGEDTTVTSDNAIDNTAVPINPVVPVVSPEPTLVDDYGAEDLVSELDDLIGDFDSIEQDLS